MITLWQNIPPSFLPSPGAVITSIIAAVLAWVTWRQRAWQSTAKAATAERDLLDKAATRLRSENDALRNENTALQKQTDLQPLATAISGWIIEGRGRFDKADASLNENTLALRAMIEEMKAQRTAFEAISKETQDSYRSLTASFIAHTLDDKQQQLEAAQLRLRTVESLNQLEDRLSQIAVRVGVPNWEKREAAGEVRTV